MKYRITVETLTDLSSEDMKMLRETGFNGNDYSAETIYEQTVDHLDLRQVILAVNPQTQPAMCVPSDNRPTRYDLTGNKPV